MSDFDVVRRNAVEWWDERQPESEAALDATLSAFDRIEAENARLREAVTENGYMALAAQRENARLREALKRIAAWCDHVDDGEYCPGVGARAALSYHTHTPLSEVREAR